MQSADSHHPRIFLIAIILGLRKQTSYAVPSLHALLLAVASRRHKPLFGLRKLAIAPGCKYCVREFREERRRGSFVRDANCVAYSNTLHEANHVPLVWYHTSYIIPSKLQDSTLTWWTTLLIVYMILVAQWVRM